jgi:GT2 family glycosyltransferase
MKDVDSTAHPLFSIVILNWNSLEYLQKCLDALRLQSFRSFEVICVDNGSVDDSRTWLDNTDLTACVGAHARILLNETNAGFAAGMNRGMRAARGEWIMPLNVDVFLADDYLEQAARAVSIHEGCDILGAKIFRYDNGHTDEVICTGVSPTKHMSVITDVKAPDGEYAVFGPAGCCPLYSRRALDAAAMGSEYTGVAYSQYYDEVYFAYGEDVDLYLRLNLLGFTCLYSSALRAWHVHSATQAGIRWYDKDAATIRRLAGNAVFTWLKNCQGSMFWLGMVRMLFLPVVMSAALVCKRPTVMVQPLAAYGRVIHYLPRMMRIRKFLQRNKQISSRDFKNLFIKQG